LLVEQRIPGLPIPTYHPRSSHNLRQPITIYTHIHTHKTRIKYIRTVYFPRLCTCALRCPYWQSRRYRYRYRSIAICGINNAILTPCTIRHAKGQRMNSSNCDFLCGFMYITCFIYGRNWINIIYTDRKYKMSVSLQ